MPPAVTKKVNRATRDTAFRPPLKTPILRASWGAPVVRTFSQIQENRKLRVKIIAPENYTREQFTTDLVTHRLRLLLNPSTYDGKTSPINIQLDVKDHVESEIFMPSHYRGLYGRFSLYDVYCELSEQQTDLIKQVLDERHGRGLFDLTLQEVLPNGTHKNVSVKKRSLVIEAKEGKEVNVAHFSDPHVAQRNDKFAALVQQEPSLKDLQSDFINFNDRLRNLVEKLNQLYKQGNLDFAIGTGDLIDFAYKETIPFWRYTLIKWRILKPRLKDTNWEPFEKIMETAEFPVFLTPGNHDYRRPAYHMLVLYGAFGLKSLGQAFRLVIKHIATKGFIRRILTRVPIVDRIVNLLKGIWYGINSLSKGEDSVLYYHLRINPDKHYKRKYAGRTYIFLDTGSDYIPHFLSLKWWVTLLPRLLKSGSRAWREIKATFSKDMDSSKDLIGGSPDSEGFGPKVLEWVSEQIKRAEKAGRPLPIIAQHSPLINISGKINPKELTPGEREKVDKVPDLATDPELDLDYGTFVNGREQMLQLYPLNILRLIAGHAHGGTFSKISGPEAGYQFYIRRLEDGKKDPPISVIHDDFTKPMQLPTPGIIEQVQAIGPFSLLPDNIEGQLPQAWDPGFHLYTFDSTGKLKNQKLVRLYEINPTIAV